MPIASDLGIDQGQSKRVGCQHQGHTNRMVKPFGAHTITSSVPDMEAK